MASNNKTIQSLLNQVESLDLNDSSLEDKLQLIAQKVAEEQQKVKAAATNLVHQNIADPADAFACDGCQ